VAAFNARTTDQEESMRLKSLTRFAVIPALLLASTSQAAAPNRGAPTRQPTTTMNCWGVVSSQLAQVEGGIGEHSSSQATPRLGLGNVARLFFEMGLIDSPNVSSLGSLLAQLDEYDETVCPIQ
jgi:hypothetical protein